MLFLGSLIHICIRLDNEDCTEICTDSKFGFDENSEFIIFNFKKEYNRKIEVIFKTQVDRKQIAIGDLQIFYTESNVGLPNIDRFYEFEAY